MPIVRPVVGVWGTPEATLATAINFANSRLESSLIESKRSSTGGNAVAWGHASGKSLHHKRESGKSGIRKGHVPLWPLGAISGLYYQTDNFANFLAAARPSKIGRASCREVWRFVGGGGQ